MTQPGTSRAADSHASAPDPSLEPAPEQSAATLGATLRQARERQGLELADIAEVTHVRREYLAALEEGRYADLPEDVYARNFLRLYAQTVGLEHEALLDRYRRERGAALGSESAAATSRAAGAATSERSERREPRRGVGFDVASLLPTMLTVLLFVAVIAIGLWIFNNNLFTTGRTEAPTTVQADPPAGGSAAAGAAATSSGLAAPLEPAATSGDSAGAAPSAETGAAAAAATAAAAEAPREVLLTISTTPPGARVMVDNFVLPGTTPIVAERITARDSRVITVTREGFQVFEESFDMTTDRNLTVALTPLQSGVPAVGAADTVPGASAAATPAAADAVPPGAPLAAGQVEISVTGETWLEVYASNARGVGERLVYTTAQPGARFVFSAPLFVRAGNAAGVQVRQGSGQVSPLGSSGEVVNRTYTP